MGKATKVKKVTVTVEMDDGGLVTLHDLTPATGGNPAFIWYDTSRALNALTDRVGDVLRSGAWGKQSTEEPR